MQPADYFFFELDVDGAFESPRAKEFHPHLPHDRSFKAGSVWPDREKYPLGVHPLNNGEFNYTWTPDDSFDPRTRPPKTQVRSASLPAWAIADLKTRSEP
jgi:hypothetical protein